MKRCFHTEVLPGRQRTPELERGQQTWSECVRVGWRAVGHRRTKRTKALSWSKLKDTRRKHPCLANSLPQTGALGRLYDEHLGPKLWVHWGGQCNASSTARGKGHNKMEKTLSCDQKRWTSTYHDYPTAPSVCFRGADRSERRSRRRGLCCCPRRFNVQMVRFAPCCSTGGIYARLPGTASKPWVAYESKHVPL